MSAPAAKRDPTTCHALGFSHNARGLSGAGLLAACTRMWTRATSLCSFAQGAVLCRSIAVQIWSYASSAATSSCAQQWPEAHAFVKVSCTRVLTGQQGAQCHNAITLAPDQVALAGALKHERLSTSECQTDKHVREPELTSKLGMDETSSRLTASTNIFMPLRSSSLEKNAMRHTGLVGAWCSISASGNTLGMVMASAGSAHPRWRR